MKKLDYILNLLLLLTITACNSEPSKTIDTLEDEKKEVVNSDTLDTYQFATRILNGKVRPSDNQQTFDCLEHLTSDNKDSLNFYFEVYKVILDKSDGALSEVLGQYTMEFIKSNPDYFVGKFEKMQLPRRQKIISAMAYEFYFSENYEQEINSYFSDVTKSLENDTEPNRKYLDYLKQSTLIETNKLLDE